MLMFVFIFSGLTGSSVSGSVTWFSPHHALRVVLQPNTWSASNPTVCIKALRGVRSASMYLERSGRLELLLQLQEDDRYPEQIRCIRVDVLSIAIFLQANPQNLDGPGTVTFLYELLQQESSVMNIHLNTADGVFF